VGRIVRPKAVVNMTGPLTLCVLVSSMAQLLTPKLRRRSS
jgi:hypothetical protein